MARTIEAQKKRRYKRALRWDLVHSAGCVEATCASKDPIAIVDNVNEAMYLGVRIPRRYRKFLV